MYGRYSGNKRKSYGGRLYGSKRGYARRRGSSNWLQPRAYRNLSSRLLGNPRADAIINRSSAVIPHAYYTKLKFAFTASWTSTSGLAVYASIRSSIGDPTGSLGTTRPLGAAALDALYTRWTCLGSRCKLTAIQNSVTNKIGSNHVLIPHPNTANPFTSIDVIRAGTATGARQMMINENSTGERDSSISAYASTAQYYGVSNSRIVDDPNFGGTGTTDPSFYVIWIIGAQSADVSTTTSGIYKVELTYYVRYWQRNIDPAP